jgi:hypothetical protein
MNRDEEIDRLTAEKDRLLVALKEIEACYVDKFGGAIHGLRDGVPLHRPCEIARAALNITTTVGSK